MEQVDLNRLKNCMRRAANGEELTIGFLGGSITQGSLATKPEYTYAYRVFSWWKETFPKAKLHYVNGGIGGTTSHYGVARACSDILAYQPDFVIVDFSVNDEANDFFKETFEGLLRRLLFWDTQPAVLILNTAFFDTGVNAQEYHNAVGTWYHIPHVSVRDTICKRINAGEYGWEELSPDRLHPNDRGHELVAAEIIKLLEAIKGKLSEQEEELPIPVPMTENAYEFARLLTNKEVFPNLQGFVADKEEKTGLLDHFKNGWLGYTPGDRMIFEVEASCIAVQYRKTIDRPAARARLIIDGDEEHSMILDGNFDEDWGDCLYLEPILHHGRRGLHRIELEIIEDEIEQVTPFYLMSFIVAG